MHRNKPLPRTGIRRSVARPSTRVSLSAVVAARSGGVCELQVPQAGCTWLATEVAHRVALGMGGVHGDAEVQAHRPSNGLGSCAACHRWCHAHPTDAEFRGLLLRHGTDPASTWLVRRGVHVLLTDDGQVVDLTGVRVWDAA